MSEKIQVWRDGGRVLIRSGFSPEYDLVVELRHWTDENAWLIPPNAAITDFDKGRSIHVGPDDFPASYLGEYGTLSGNHGSEFARTLLVFDHGLGEADLGAVFTDEAGNEHCLMQILNADELLFHPVMTGDFIRPGFAEFTGEKLFRDGRMIPVIIVSPTQLYPSNRIRRDEFLIDGERPLPERELTDCTFLDRVFDYDVVAPGALVDMVRNHPGRRHFPEFTTRRTMVKMPEHEGDPKYDDYRTLPALLSYDVTMRYEGSGACVIDRRTTVGQGLTSLEALDVMSIWSGESSEMPIQEFYIPKVVPFTLTARDGRSVRMDFAAVARFDKNFPADCRLSQRDCSAPERQPDRFIRFSGGARRELGFALGYSLCHGLSADPAWRALRPDIYEFRHTWKMYPRIFCVSAPEAGWHVETVCYRQYFNPALESDATAYLWHHERDDLLVYLDFHRDLRHKVIRLPDEVVGCPMKVVEKTDSVVVTAPENTAVPQVVVDVNGGSGYVVLRFFHSLPW